MTSCTFKQGQWNCGSYQFNLYKYDIDQGDLCDVHYWQDQAQTAHADEREACAQLIESLFILDDAVSEFIAKAIRARGNHD